MRYKSFSILLNIIFGFLIFGAILSYKKGNFDGISLKKLKENYIAKSLLSFQDLSAQEQKKYISKKSLGDINESFIDIDSQNMDENKINSIVKLRKLVSNLKYKISIIQKDNINLYNDKEDTQSLMKEMKKEFAKQRDRLLKENLKQINETEQQHYKNISELTKKLNDLRRENIKISQNNNIEIIALKAKINILNDKLSKLKQKRKKTSKQ